jgi:2-polyprenyl-3-methyl-5-hydroxy-6-metoxy-1,4-benzoquinol methylase
MRFYSFSREVCHVCRVDRPESVLAQTVQPYAGFDIALTLLQVTPQDTILDVGTGDGYMLRKLLTATPRRVVGYEPPDTQYRELALAVADLPPGQVVIAPTLDGLGESSFAKICCLEVLEHLQPAAQRTLLEAMRGLLSLHGRLVMSVPIEVGWAAVLKNGARWLLGQTHDQTTLANVWKAWRGTPIARGEEVYLPSHIGFDFHDLFPLFAAVGLKRLQTRYSPLPLLGPALNAQVFYVLGHDG